MKYNIIIKPKKFDRFTVVPNYILRHKGITIGATGLYCWLFSHESSQKITVEFICGHFKENQTAIRNKINELIKNGYLERKRVYKNGKILGMNYILKAENLNTENLNKENQLQSNTNNNNTIISNTNVLDHFIKLFPNKFHPKTDSQIKKWKTTLDQIERIDGYDLRKVYKIVKFIRNHNFWQNHFLSLPKLRNLDKNGGKWIHRFDVVYNDENKPNGFKKIKNLKKFYLYSDLIGNKGLGAELKNGTDLNMFNLQQVLSDNEIEEIIEFINE
jgi:predicted transcriptional regulator